MSDLQSINEKYLQALSLSNKWLTVSEWALKVADLFPYLLASAEALAGNQKKTLQASRKLPLGLAHVFPVVVLVGKLK